MEASTGPQIRQLCQASGVEDVIAINRWDRSSPGNDIPENLYAVYFTGNAFQFFRWHAVILGRYFMPSDAPDGQRPQPVAVLSYNFLAGNDHSDPGIVGQQPVQQDDTILELLALLQLSPESLRRRCL